MANWFFEKWLYSWFVLLSETEGVRDVTDKESLSENNGAPFCLFPADSLSHGELW